MLEHALRFALGKAPTVGCCDERVVPFPDTEGMRERHRKLWLPLCLMAIGDIVGGSNRSALIYGIDLNVRRQVTYDPSRITLAHGRQDFSMTLERRLADSQPLTIRREERRSLVCFAMILKMHERYYEIAAGLLDLHAFVRVHGPPFMALFHLAAIWSAATVHEPNDLAAKLDLNNSEIDQ
jgi:hypothetical protein